MDNPIEKGILCEDLCNPRTFAQVYDHLASKIYRYAFLRLSSQEDAEDVLSGAFLRLWNYAQKNKHEIENVSALVYRITHNLIVDEYRKRKPSLSIELLAENGFEFTSTKGLASEVAAEHTLVLEAFNKLSDYDRELLVLRFIQEVPVFEIAEIYSITENNASVRIYRAVQKLKDIVNK